MRCNNVAAIIAAEIATTFRLSPRLVQLTPRAFQLLSRSRSISTTTHQSLENTVPHRAGLAGTVPPNPATINRSHEDTVVQPVASIPQEAQTPAVIDYERQRAFFVDLMRTVPHPVAIITARKQDVDDDIQGTVAATVSSFNTVSLNPELVVSFNLKADSITYQTLVQSRYFTISFPTTTSEGASLVHSFTKGNTPSPFTLEYSDRPPPEPVQWLPDAHKTLLGLAYPPPAVALKAGADQRDSGLAFAIACEYQTSTPVGDHVIVTGRLPPVMTKLRLGTWGAMMHEHPNAINHITLAHAHGSYSNSATGTAFADLYKSGDRTLGSATDDGAIDSKIAWCHRRLSVLAAAQMIQKGTDPESEFDNSQRNLLSQIRAASKDISPTQLKEYESYYMQRLHYWELQKQKRSTNQVSEPSTATPSNETDNETPSYMTHSHRKNYTDLAGHQQLFIRNKMLLDSKDLNEEIAMYSMRLSALRIKAKGDLSAQVAEEQLGDEEELAPEESRSDPNLHDAEDGASRDLQLRRYFRDRIFLLQFAKTRKIEMSSTHEPINSSAEEHNDPSWLKRFRGVQSGESISGLKTKYRRYQYQITEARVALIGLEQLPGGHQNVQILGDRIAYFQPRLAIIEDLIRARAASATTKDLLVDNFKIPPMRFPEEEERDKGYKSKSKPRSKSVVRLNNPTGNTTKRPDLVNIKKVYAQEEEEVDGRTNDSTDQLDDHIYDLLDRREKSQAAVERASQNLPVGIPRRSTTDYLRNEIKPGSIQVEHSVEPTQMEGLQKDLMRRNASEVRDYLVMRGLPGEDDKDMPSPSDFLDVNKMMRERMRKEEEESRKG